VNWIPLLTQAQAGVDGGADFNSSEAIAALGFFFAIATIGSVLIWQGMTTWRARMSVAREAAYRQLADDSVKAQERTADRLDRTVAELTELRQRTAELERLLKEVG
jgi:acyl-homoserine lactone acylase PvdQ